ncbi:MAG: MurR/RpiR family transcriptional regulator [Rhodoferax sp.]|uniref:MurR/RpiR family transcriptional regulator n=1 Tax=Rhodoferax sp. TaxID=50421 RepID=UPI00261B6CE9|nr:MurR/RpiR family transcriptional regulator [Rhodoferax sp.]MDD5334589.1 MurR/RpiR family transcriptional regulator [Rhodoferax sp.]
MTQPCESLAAKIRQAYDALSVTERKLADVVLTRQKDLLSYSATELAKLAGVSKASAARFFRRLGFADFHAFRQHVRSQVSQQSPLFRMDLSRTRQSALSRLEQHVQQDALRLRALLDGASDDTLERALALLTQARRILVVGYRNSAMTAFHAHALLSQVRPGVQLLNDMAGQAAEMLADLDATDVLLVLDFRRRTRRLAPLVAAARSAKVRLLLLTDAQLSALTSQAAVVLHCPSPGATPMQQIFDSYVAAVSLVNYLAGAVAARTRKQARSRMARIEDLHTLLHDLETDS